MFSALEKIEKRYDAIAEKMGDPDVVTNRSMFEKLAKELSDIKPIVLAYRNYRKARESLEEAEAVIAEGADPELMELAAEEKDTLVSDIDRLEKEIRILLLPKDPNEGKNIILEIRAGTGGEEAGLFSSDLFRMYSRYAERRGWKIEVLSASETGKGGFKEIIATVLGKDAYSRLKFESGAHRVQRVPATEASGRVHTSACTVAILPEATQVEVEIDPNDLKIDVYRSSGHGGQSVNTTDSAVRMTHIPTGIVVTMQDEKSQNKNKIKAMKVLAARIQDRKSRESAAKRASERKSQVGTGDRSERIRTYNFSQGRVTDHRINLTLYNLDNVLDGDLDVFTDALTLDDQQAALLSGIEAAAEAEG